MGIPQSSCYVLPDRPKTCRECRAGWVGLGIRLGHVKGLVMAVGYAGRVGSKTPYAKDGGSLSCAAYNAVIDRYVDGDGYGVLGRVDSVWT